MKRLVSIDYGTKRIGVAASDLMQCIVSPLGTISSSKTDGERVLLLKELITIAEVEKIIVGNPLHMDGKESLMSSKAREFALLIENTFTIPTLLWDERLTSKQVERLMESEKSSKKKIKQHVDTLSAVLILQSYMSATQPH